MHRLQQATDLVGQWNPKNHILVSAKTVKYLVKSGRLSHSKGVIGKLLGVRPIISIDDDGKAITFGKAFNQKGSMKQLMDEASRLVEKGKIWGYAISHIRNPETAQWYATQMETLTGKKPLFVNECSPVLGVHGGPGTVVLSIMEE